METYEERNAFFPTRYRIAGRTRRFVVLRPVAESTADHSDVKLSHRLFNEQYQPATWRSDPRLLRASGLVAILIIAVIVLLARNN